MTETDEFWMSKAIEAARVAELLDEVPIGACIIDREGNLLAVAGNRTITDNDPTAHAEILVLREAAARMSNYRLVETTIYTTIEPCAMCAGALVLARIDRLVLGAPDPKAGFAGSLGDIVRDGRLNHEVEVTVGVLAEECGEVLRAFFAERR